MRCYIKLRENEDIKSYQSFLEDVFKTSFMQLGKKINGFTQLYTKEYSKFALIRGENFEVINFIMNNVIMESNIVLMTCTANEVIRYIKRLKPYRISNNKNIYSPKYIDESANVLKYDGNEYHLHFNPTMSEIKLWRFCDELSLIENLNNCFTVKKVKEIILDE